MERNRLWPVRLKSTDGTHCEMQADLLVGRTYPEGVDLIAELTGAPGIRFDAIRFPYVNQFKPDYAGKTVETAVTNVVWRVYSSKAKGSIPFTLILSSDHVLERSQWESLAGQVTLDHSGISKEAPAWEGNS